MHEREASSMRPEPVEGRASTSAVLSLSKGSARMHDLPAAEAAGHPEDKHC
jgi:hypothetical protein